MSIDSWLKGYPPQVVLDMGNKEAEKYGRMWRFDEYRKVSPGEFYCQWFLQKATPRPGAHVIDFGCGTGRGGAMLASLGQMRVTMIDFVNNCLDDNVRRLIENESYKLQFIKADLEKPLPVVAEYGFCSDVMEHIPPDKIDHVLDNILQATQYVWFSIALFEDECGHLINERLHLSVHPFEWWKEKLEAHGCKFLHAQSDRVQHNDAADYQMEYYAHFYVSAWHTGKEISENGRLNTEEEQILRNVKTNVARGFMQVSPHETNDLELMILGGGPSLNDYVDEIKKNRAEGVKLLTLNGAYNWAAHYGIIPSATVVVDARPFNKRFVQPVLPECKYLIASQVDPSILDGLPKDRTYIWHTAAEQLSDILNAQYGENTPERINWWAVPGGSTVLLRSIPMMRMLGYRKFILYGCDSCLGSNEQHHAYEQPENDAPYKIPVILNPSGRLFYCTLWQISQAHEFIDTIKYLADEIELDVKGDGLLANILKVGAAEADLQKLE